MSSTIFAHAVTQVPAAWANDVNRVIYDVLAAPQSLTELQARLGLGPLLDGGPLRVIGGEIESTPIGQTNPADGRFSRLRVTGNGSGLTDVVTHQQLLNAITGATENVKSMAYQDASLVVIAGGNIDGTHIGAAVAATGRFTKLRADAPVNGDDVVILSHFDERWSSLPSFGTMAEQNGNAVALTGGYMDNVVIGATTPTEAAFTRINSKQILGNTAQVFLDAGGPGAAGYAALIDLTSSSALDFGVRAKAGGSFIFSAPEGSLRFRNGHLLIGGTTDDGVNALQVTGTAKADRIYLGNVEPLTDDEVASKQYVDLQVYAATEAIGPAITAQWQTLGQLAHQNRDSVLFSGGSMDGVVIGGIEPTLASFTQVTAPLVTGPHGTLRLDGTGGYSNSGVVLSAVDDTRPSVCVMPNDGGAFVVMAGNAPVFRSNVNGRTVVGFGGDDGLNTLQVHGDTKLNGRLTLGGGVVQGATTASFGSMAPPLVNANNPLWVRIRVQTPSGLRECVMPAWEVM